MEEIEMKNGDNRGLEEEKNFLTSLNKYLGETESSLMQDVKEEIPNIFLLGLPRSGTTLLAQILFNNLDIACTNSFVARFFESPLTGCMLSKIILGDRKSNVYKSSYGKPVDMHAPHEFSWFWQNLLNYKDITVYKPEEARKSIDWLLVKSKLLDMNRVFEAPLIHKPLELMAFHMEQFNDLFDKALFIYIERDSIDITYSLTKARLSYYNDLDEWWGSYPTEYNEISRAPWWEQVPAQVHYLLKLYEDKLPVIDESRFLKTTYQDLCKDPQQLLEDVKTKVKDISGYSVKQINDPPSLTASKPNLDDALITQLAKGIEKYNLKSTIS